MRGRHRRAAGALAAVLLAAAIMPSSMLTAWGDTAWPSDCQVESDAAIAMEADTGTVLFGKNIHEVYAPASITKVLTALIVLERASLQDEVVFSDAAVHQVEDNSSTAGYEPGDRASVEDLLYALLLKSANESANALAEHVSGSTEEFARLMNQRAAELGCVDSHFNNPSGLNDPDHYVSAYDMALITAAALDNPEFARVVRTPYYELPPNSKFPEGQGISPGNKLIKSNWPAQYRPDAIGGKTGYTSLALHTLVNGAQQGDMRVVTVILHSRGTQYEDTNRMLDFAFAHFYRVELDRDTDLLKGLRGDLLIGGYGAEEMILPALSENTVLVLPDTAELQEVTLEPEYGEEVNLRFMLGSQQVGEGRLELRTAAADTQQDDPAVRRSVAGLLGISPEEAEPADAAEDAAKAQTGMAPVTGLRDILQNGKALLTAGVMLILALIFAGWAAWRRRTRQEEAAQLERRRRREERLRDSSMSQGQFDLLMSRRRERMKHNKKEE